MAGLLAVLLLLAACQSAGDPLPTQPPTPVPFPSVTPGLTIRGALTPPPARALDGSEGVNPATAIARAEQPTATPNIAACPPTNPDTQLATDLPATAAAIRQEIARFLTAGGTLDALENGLRDDWGILGEDGYLRNDIDFTGEGLPELLLGYSITGVEDAGGTLLLIGCVDRQYIVQYSYVAQQPLVPQLYGLGDMNFDRRNDLLFAEERCAEIDAETGERDDCRFVTELVTWQPDAGRYASLLGVDVISTAPPQITDVDNDEVSELVIRRADDGDAETGPLRTGTDIYDWNGEVYVLSIVQPDPLRYTIQVIHEADRQLAVGEAAAAAELYRVALSDPELEPWFNNDTDVLPAYALYRLLVTQAFIQPEGMAQTLQTLNETYPDPAQAPVYVAMAAAFFEEAQTTGNLPAACVAARSIAQADEAALDLLNRYGSRNPTYTVAMLCPY